jgi:hypothetical protein
MKANPNIDELLCSYLDGELPARQQTEVQRLVTRDPEVGRRLRQLQNCKTLISSLPRAQAPVEMLERIRASVERKALLEEASVSGVSTAGARRLMARRVLAAAAMIALVGVLAAVVYQIVAPIPGGSTSRPVASTSSVPSQPAAVMPVADTGFTGRLEIRTATVAPADAVLKRAFEENGLSSLVQSDIVADARSYRLTGSREAANRLVASLGGMWQSFDAVTLSVEGPGQSASPVMVEALTPQQAIDIVAQGSTQASIETARNYAVANAVAANTPGREALKSLDNNAGIDLTPAIPNVWLTRRVTPTTLTPPQGESNVTLTIVLLRTK